MVKGYYVGESMDLRSLNRSPYRNMPEKCLRCAYASKPSSFGTMCCMCSGKYKDKEK